MNDLRWECAAYYTPEATHGRARAGREEEGLVILCIRAVLTLGVTLLAAAASGETLAGSWKIVAAEDLRADGTVARYPWGRRPIGSIIVEGGSCYVQIMSSDVQRFGDPAPSITEQMKGRLLSSYIAYTGPCTFDDAAGTTTMTVEAAWRPDYVGTSQTRFYRFDGGRMLYGPAQGSITAGGERLTRRLTLERP